MNISSTGGLGRIGSAPRRELSHRTPDVVTEALEALDQLASVAAEALSDAMERGAGIAILAEADGVVVMAPGPRVKMTPAASRMLAAALIDAADIADDGSGDA